MTRRVRSAAAQAAGAARAASAQDLPRAAAGPGSEDFYLPPLVTLVADPDGLDIWLPRARAGERFLIAAGRVRPQSAPVWLAAREAERRGMGRIIAEPAEGGAQRWWLEMAGGSAADESGGGVARGVAGGESLFGRARASLRPAGGGRGKDEPRTSDGELVTDAMLRIIRRAVNLGQPAPSLTALARAGELRSGPSAAYWLEQMARRCVISIEEKMVPGGTARRFFVHRDGKALGCTGWTKTSGSARRGDGQE
jgi:hypothetical protein